MYTTDKKEKWVLGANIKWDILPQYPSCQGFDPREYFDLGTYTPLQIAFMVAKVENIGVSFYFEDRNKALRRKQRSNILSYLGPSFQNKHLNDPTEMAGIFKISQTINSDRDPSKNCKNYPNSVYESYKDCDENNLRQYFLKSSIMPPWATRNMEEVTILRL